MPARAKNPNKKPAAPAPVSEHVGQISLKGTTCLVLKDKREILLTHDNGSLYRMSKMPGGIPQAQRLANPRTFYGAAVDFAWCMLPKPFRASFPEPEDLAQVLPSDDVEVLLTAVTNALNEYAERTATGDTLGNG